MFSRSHIDVALALSLDSLLGFLVAYFVFLYKCLLVVCHASINTLADLTRSVHPGLAWLDQINTLAECILGWPGWTR